MASYDVAIAHHVLEHIDDDRAAMREIFRILRPGGFAILTVPINATREHTYENPAITDPVLRALHFSAPDHRRYYGLDFETRLQEAGFTHRAVSYGTGTGGGVRAAAGRVDHHRA